MTALGHPPPNPKGGVIISECRVALNVTEHGFECFGQLQASLLDSTTGAGGLFIDFKNDSSSQLSGS